MHIATSACSIWWYKFKFWTYNFIGLQVDIKISDPPLIYSDEVVSAEVIENCNSQGLTILIWLKNGSVVALPYTQDLENRLNGLKIKLATHSLKLEQFIEFYQKNNDLIEMIDKRSRMQVTQSVNANDISP